MTQMDRAVIAAVGATVKHRPRFSITAETRVRIANSR